MKFIRVNDAKEGGQVAFCLLKDYLKKGARTLGLATGSTPETFYQEICQSDLDFSDVITINLDEYVGLGASDAQSYATYMQNHLFQYKEFREHFLPDGLAQNLTAEVLRYNQILSDYPIDFQILGIGRNGHIGFNEPGSRFSELTRVVDLAPSTIAANARFFSSPEQVPKQAISMGIASILAAKTIVLMAYGSDKAEAVYQMVNGPVTEELPASSLQNHPDVYVIVDSEAGSRLTNHES